MFFDDKSLKKCINSLNAFIQAEITLCFSKFAIIEKRKSSAPKEYSFYKTGIITFQDPDTVMAKKV